MSAATRASGLSVPEVGLAPLGPVTGENPVHGATELRTGHQPIGALADGNRALGRGAQRQAGNAQIGGLLLDAPRIRDGQTCAADEVHEIHVSQRLDDLQAGSPGKLGPETEGFKILARARVHRKHQRQPRRDARQLGHQFREWCGGIHVGGTVQGDHAVIASLEPELVPFATGLDAFAHELVGIDHDVADARDPFRRHALGGEVLVPVRRRRPEDVGDGIRRQPVDFLGHPSITAAQPRLQVCHRNVQFRSDQRAGDC